MQPDFRMPTTNCPHCNAELNASTYVRGGGRDGFKTRPNAGDVTVCINCGNICVFGNNYTLTKPDPKMLPEYLADHDVIKTMTAVRFAKRARERN